MRSKSVNKSKRGLRGNRSWAPLAPALVIYTIQFILPLIFVAYTSLRDQSGTGDVSKGYTFENFMGVLTEPYFHSLFLRSIGLSLSVVIVTILLGYPLAYVLARGPGWVRPLLITLILVPWLTNSVVRAFGWMVVFDADGLLSRIAGPLASPTTGLMNTFTGVLIALSHVLLPFMVFTLYGIISDIDKDMIEASRNLGASAFETFRLVVLPLTLNGLIAGSILVFGTAISNFVTPALIGGTRYRVVPTEVYDQALNLLDWPMASALALCLLVLALFSTSLYSLLSSRTRIIS